MPYGPMRTVQAAPYYPHPGAFLDRQGGAQPNITPGTGDGAWYYQITVLSANASTLGALIRTAQGGAGHLGIPQVFDEGPTLVSLRPPNHVFFQLLSGATNLVYMTWDNVTVPVAGSIGMELEKGVIYPFENSRNLLTKKSSGLQQVAADSAFQLIAATANQTMSVWFSD